MARTDADEGLPLAFVGVRGWIDYTTGWSFHGQLLWTRVMGGTLYAKSIVPE